MNHSCNFLGKSALEGALAGVVPMFLNKVIDGFLVERCEYFDVFLGIVVGHIKPELIEGVGGGSFGVEPYISAFGFSEFLSVCFCDKLACEAVCAGFLSEGSAY